MSEKTLPVAVIGLGAFGRQMLQALRNCPQVSVIAVGDKNPSLVDEVAHETGVPGYSDNRQLLAEARPEAVFLDVPPMVVPELITTCAKRGIHVWKDAPLARSLEEGISFVQSMAKAKCKLAVGTQRRFASCYRHAWEVRQRLGELFLARAHYLFNWGPNLDWRGDRESAGGGALLELGYHPIDLLVWMLGVPEEVYGLNACGNRPNLPDGEPQPVYNTDDTAAAVLRFSSQAMASVVTTRSSGPVSEELCLHGRGGSLMVNAERCLVRDPDGNLVDQVENDVSVGEVFGQQAQAFVDAVISESDTYNCSGLENLLNLAVIEAIYLSTRTCQPESPIRLLKTAGLEVDDCLKLRPISAEDEQDPSRDVIIEADEE